MFQNEPISDYPWPITPTENRLPLRADVGRQWANVPLQDIPLLVGNILHDYSKRRQLGALISHTLIEIEFFGYTGENTPARVSIASIGLFLSVHPEAHFYSMELPGFLLSHLNENRTGGRSPIIAITCTSQGVFW